MGFFQLWTATGWIITRHVPTPGLIVRQKHSSWCPHQECDHTILQTPSMLSKHIMFLWCWVSNKWSVLQIFFLKCWQWIYLPRSLRLLLEAQWIECCVCLLCCSGGTSTSTKSHNLAQCGRIQRSYIAGFCKSIGWSAVMLLLMLQIWKQKIQPLLIWIVGLENYRQKAKFTNFLVVLKGFFFFFSNRDCSIVLHLSLR